MRPQGRFALGGALIISTLSFFGCSSGGDGNGGPQGDGDGDNGPTTLVETRGGDELVAHEAQQGTVSIVGSSAAVPVSNRSLTGFRDPTLDGQELVRCNYFPNGNTDYQRPHLEILAGIQGWKHYQAQAQIFEVAEGDVVDLPLSPDDSIEEETQDLIVFASLTHEMEEGAYRYWYGIDPNVYPPRGSECSVEITKLGDDWTTGSVRCTNLIALPDSPDAPVSPAQYPTAQVTVDFDCPLVNRDPGGGTASSESKGSCTGSPNPCLILDYSECADTAGCRPTGTCGGIATQCSTYFEFYSCEYQQGCYWSGFECYGFADSCFSFDGDEFGCNLHSGCDWRDDCEGEALSCAAFHSQETCEFQGCSWEVE